LWVDSDRVIPAFEAEGVGGNGNISCPKVLFEKQRDINTTRIKKGIFFVLILGCF